MLIRSLARVIKCASCRVFWCDATSCDLCMSRFSRHLKESALFGASRQRKFPEKQQINGFSKSVRLSEHCSQALDKQFPLFCFFIYFVAAAHSTVSHLKVLVPGKITKSEKRTWWSSTLSPKLGPFCLPGKSKWQEHTDAMTTGFSRQAWWSKHRFSRWSVGPPIRINHCLRLRQPRAGCPCDHFHFSFTLTHRNTSRPSSPRNRCFCSGTHAGQLIHHNLAVTHCSAPISVWYCVWKSNGPKDTELTHSRSHTHPEQASCRFIGTVSILIKLRCIGRQSERGGSAVMVTDANH